MLDTTGSILHDGEQSNSRCNSSRVDCPMLSTNIVYVSYPIHRKLMMSTSRERAMWRGAQDAGWLALHTRHQMMMMMMHIGTDILPPNHQCGVAMSIGCRVVPICCLNCIDVTDTHQQQANDSWSSWGSGWRHRLGVDSFTGSKGAHHHWSWIPPQERRPGGSRSIPSRAS